MSLFEWMASYVSHHRKPVAIGLLVLFLIFYAGFVRAPLDFPEGGYIVIEKGMTVTDAARVLEEKRIIQSSAFFAWLIRTLGAPGGVLSGTYAFKDAPSVFGVADRLSRGDFGSALVRVTVPEGATAREMAHIFREAISGFDGERFLGLALPSEGYLFPDTYLFAPGTTAETAVAVLMETFDERIASLEEDIDAFGKPVRDIVIMASLLEKEARQFETRRTVAGILWKRLELGMPLQVDAVFGYILGTKTFSPTFDQLKLDSPYNTYIHIGLPPGPIGNPGLDSLKAAVNPQESPYLYYLTGADGAMYYAKTFDEHVANRRFLK